MIFSRNLLRILLLQSGLPRSRRKNGDDQSLSERRHKNPKTSRYSSVRLRITISFHQRWFLSRALQVYFFMYMGLTVNLSLSGRIRIRFQIHFIYKIGEACFRFWSTIKYLWLWKLSLQNFVLHMQFTTYICSLVRFRNHQPIDNFFRSIRGVNIMEQRPCFSFVVLLSSTSLLINLLHREKKD